MQIAYLLISADGQHDVPGSDPVLLAILGHISGQLQNLGSEVLQHTGEVDGSQPLVVLGQRVVAWVRKCRNCPAT